MISLELGVVGKVLMGLFSFSCFSIRWVVEVSMFLWLVIWLVNLLSVVVLMVVLLLLLVDGSVIEMFWCVVIDVIVVLMILLMEVVLVSVFLCRWFMVLL